MSRIFITGDTHADYDWKKLMTKSFPVQKKLTKDDYVIIAGDFGGVFHLDRTDKYIQKNYNERNFTTLFVDGNHENHDALDAYPVEEWHGGKIHKIADSVFHLMRGQVFEIGGKTFFTMGGAESTDKQYRKEGRSWWAREMPSIDEYEEAGQGNELLNYSYQLLPNFNHCIGIELTVLEKIMTCSFLIFR